MILCKDEEFSKTDINTIFCLFLGLHINKINAQNCISYNIAVCMR